MKRIKNTLVAFGGLSLLVGIIALTTYTAPASATPATPPSGILSGTVLARASFADPVDIEFKLEKNKWDGTGQQVIHVRDAQQTVIQQIVIGPGGHTGWHSHPGPAVALVKAARSGPNAAGPMKLSATAASSVSSGSWSCAATSATIGAALCSRRTQALRAAFRR